MSRKSCNRTLKNLSSLPFRGVRQPTDDEESPKSRASRARFLASLGMTGSKRVFRHPANCRGVKGPAPATVFAALGDETRLFLVAKLCAGERCSISQLTKGSRLTRQAITKHLRVLENARIVRSHRSGRQSLFEFNPQPVEDIKRYLDLVSAQWDQALSRLKSFVEG